ncbi:MAG TPA: 16S rRNA (adenine(1518)-N(6)/adenine(1519)-N(6))-dimethyltransferase RsmA, partial [Actinomycetospora sp.]|nr:16S rRNA (adenine(1518)-N(6)/adenine(1519)-N(6))-dimethyltransferase RsmA [Actinomycetospora sp.]
MSEPHPVRLLGASDVRALAAELELRPTKRLGQNFVHDANTVRRIVRRAEVGPDDVVLEVGPGLGSLTLPLLEAAATVVAVEIDPVLVGRLPAAVAERAPDADLRVVTADALRLAPADLPVEPTALVANLPYNVAVPVVLHLLAVLPGLRRALVMVQAEVAERLAARPGERAYGAPSAKLAWYGEARRAGPVPRAVFWPVPGVDSGLVAFARHPDPVESDVPRRDV